MKNRVLILGNLNGCKFVFEKIKMDLIESLTFVVSENDINDKWFEDKNKVLIRDVKRWIMIGFLL